MKRNLENISIDRNQNHETIKEMELDLEVHKSKIKIISSSLFFISIFTGLYLMIF